MSRDGFDPDRAEQIIRYQCTDDSLFVNRDSFKFCIFRLCDRPRGPGSDGGIAKSFLYCWFKRETPIKILYEFLEPELKTPRFKLIHEKREIHEHRDMQSCKEKEISTLETLSRIHFDVYLR